jgi:hypothetical protein
MPEQGRRSGISTTISKQIRGSDCERERRCCPPEEPFYICVGGHSSFADVTTDLHPS